MSVRAGGATKLAIGGVGFGLMVALFVWGQRHGVIPTGIGLIALAAPGGYALAGLLELITGVKFTDIAARWDALAGWQRGVLGLLVVILAFALMMGLVVAFG